VQATAVVVEGAQSETSGGARQEPSAGETKAMYNSTTAAAKGAEAKGEDRRYQGRPEGKWR
jgi:hypothetical protein